MFQRGVTFHGSHRGCSMLTMTFTTVESSDPAILGGEQISAQVFERDRGRR